MQIARIVRITPDGAAFTTANGTFYPFQVGFDDQRAGQANSKSNPPPWKVGESVGYEVTGQTPRGADKFKIKRNPEPNDGHYNPPAQDRSNPDLEAAGGTSPGNPPPYRPAPQTARQSSQNRHAEPSEGASLKVNLPLGQTVGMAIKLAGDLQLALDPKFLANEDWPARLHAVAGQIIAISRALENDTPLENAPPF